jgi:hypothetical protein
MTLVHDTLGAERIRQICEEQGLTPEDRRIVDEILEEWGWLIGNIEKKMEVAVNKIKGSPHKQEIIRALTIINIEFFKKRLT